MSHAAIREILHKRAEFTKHLKEDVSKTHEVIASTSKKLQELEITASNIKELGKKVEHESIIPLGKKIYVNAKITHTGEYFLDRLAFPDSFSTVDTLDNTVKQLEAKIKYQSELLQKGENSKEQLMERIKLMGDIDGNSEEIVSDRGVAVKVGEFYEIVEFEN